MKECLLGAQLLGRGDSFDPRLDPIVRVQAGKLRSRLQRYYDGEGRADTLVIDFPKGGYVPVFRPRTDAAPPVDNLPRARRWRLGWLGLAMLGLAALSAVTWKKWSSASFTPPTFTQLTFATASTAAFPSISREGKLVVFASDRGERGIMDLFIQVVGGVVPVKLARSPATNRQLDISPDGSHLGSHSERDGRAT